jgi:hypothetical protein
MVERERRAAALKTVVWDVDDVLNDLTRAWFEAWWRPLPGTPEGLRYEDLTENPPCSLLGVTKADYLESLDAFRRSPEAERLQPEPEVLAWFREHGSRCRHVALTAVPLCAAGCSARWVFSHFGSWIRTFSLVPSPRGGVTAPTYDGDKIQHLGWLQRGDVLVEDQPVTVRDASAIGIPGVLMPRPWNGAGRSQRDALRELTSLACP